MVEEETEIVFETDFKDLVNEIHEKINRKPCRIERDGSTIKMYFKNDVKTEDVAKIEEAVKTRNPMMKHTKTAKINTSSSKGEKKSH